MAAILGSARLRSNETVSSSRLYRALQYSAVVPCLQAVFGSARLSRSLCTDRPSHPNLPHRKTHHETQHLRSGYTGSARSQRRINSETFDAEKERLQLQLQLDREKAELELKAANERARLEAEAKIRDKRENADLYWEQS